MSHDCCVALPRCAMSLSAVVIVIFPDHTHLLFLIVFTIVANLTVFCVCLFYCSKFVAKLTVFRRRNTHRFEANYKVVLADV